MKWLKRLWGRKKWGVFKPGDDDTHVVPLGDVIEHELDESCVCGVATEPVPRDDGTIAWLFTHHSADGRETREKKQP